MKSLTAALADRYRIQREIGAGGMATVKEAERCRRMVVLDWFDELNARIRRAR